MPTMICYLVYNSGSYMKGVVISVLSIVFSGLGVATTLHAFVIDTGVDTGRYNGELASKRANAAVEGVQDTERMTAIEQVKVVVTLGSPCMFVLFIMLVYVIVIFAVFELKEGSLWKVAITVLGLAVKIVGNKAMLLLIKGKPAWTVDWLLFFYEMTTATLLRVLQLSIPDVQTAQLMSLFGAVSEVCVRIYFYTRYAQYGMNTNFNDLRDDEKRKYASWGRMRVQDGTNDRLVEYLSSFAAALYLIYLAPLGAFDFASDATVETGVVINLLMYQLVPELFLDFYVTLIEVQGGLKKLHDVTWSLTSGRVDGTIYLSDRLGDFEKGLFLKLATCGVLTGFVLLSTLK